MAIEQERTMFGFSQLAKRWDVSEDTIKRAAKRNELRTVYFARRRLVPRSEVERIDLVGFGAGQKHNKKAAQ